MVGSPAGPCYKLSTLFCQTYLSRVWLVLLTCEWHRNSRKTGHEERVDPAVSPYGEVHWTPVPPVTLLQVSWKTFWGVTSYPEDATRHLRSADGPVESTARMSPVDSVAT